MHLFAKRFCDFQALTSPFSRQNSLPMSTVSSSCPTPIPLEIRRRSVGDLVDNLQQQLQERDQEIVQLKQQICNLQNESVCSMEVGSG